MGAKLTQWQKENQMRLKQRSNMTFFVKASKSDEIEVQRRYEERIAKRNAKKGRLSPRGENGKKRKYQMR